MKTLFVLFLLMGGSIAFADDENLLRNGDFSSGIAEWHGDCHGIGSATDDTGATSGIIVKLRSSEWTKVTQDFDGKAGNYLLTVVYTLGSGTTFSSKAGRLFQRLRRARPSRSLLLLVLAGQMDCHRKRHRN